MERASESDGVLLQSSMNGDRLAFAVLLDRYTPALTRYAWAMMTSRSDVQDVVQETWLTAWKKRRSIRIVETSMLPWLLVVCRNHSQNARRRNLRTRAEPLPDDAVGDVVGAARVTEAQQHLRWVMEEISRLNAADRRLCQLCLIDGVPYREAARLVGTSPEAARKRIERLRNRLRKAVFQDD